MGIEIEVAIVGLIGAFIGALIPSIIQIITTRQTNRISNEQFKAQMDLNYKEYSRRIDEIRAEQKRVAYEKASKEFQAENNRFYADKIREIQFYDRLLNELNYLNNISHPKQKEERMEIGVYPAIPNRVYNMVDDVELPGNIAKLIGALRAKIDNYNAAVIKGVSADTLEELLSKIYSLIGPINDERFESFSNAQTLIRDHEIAAGREQLKSLDLSDESGDAPTEPLSREKRPNIENYYVDDEG